MKIRGSALAAILVFTSTSALAEWSANLGWQSQYVFRGIPQSDSSAQGGLDFSSNGFYVGTWAADVDMGAEVDVYGGYAWDIGDVSLSVGGTGYYYTDDFDDTYTELNLGAAYQWFSASYNRGTYDNFAGPKMDYSFASVGVELAGASLTIGTFGDEFDGEYYELGYGFEVNGIDLSVGWIYSSDQLVGDNNSNLYFGISKTLGPGSD